MGFYNERNNWFLDKNFFGITWENVKCNMTIISKPTQWCFYICNVQVILQLMHLYLTLIAIPICSHIQVSSLSYWPTHIDASLVGQHSLARGPNSGPIRWGFQKGCPRDERTCFPFNRPNSQLKGKDFEKGCPKRNNLFSF